EIFFQAPGTQFAAKARLLVAAPGSFYVGRLHVIDPHDSSAKRFDNAKGFVNVPGPHSRGEAVRSVVGDANGFAFTVEGNHGSHGAEDFLASDARGVLHIIENGRLDVVAFAKLLGTAATNCDFGFFLADLEIRAHTVVLLLADQRPHFG